MRTVQDIIYGVTGQALIFDAPEGRPSSVTSCEVFQWQSADDQPELEGSGALETNPATTLDAAAGRGETSPHLIPVTATTGITEGRSYLITSVLGFKEWFEVAEIESGVSVTAKHPLHNTYASGDAVETTRITATVDADWVADEDNLDATSGPNPSYRVRWVYVVGGVTHVADSYFSLVRYAGGHGVKPQDIDNMAPGWLDRLNSDHYKDQGRRLINTAHAEVKLDLHMVWTDDAMVANTEIIDELTRYKTLELAERDRAMNGGDGRGYEIARTAYQSRLDALARVTSKVPIRNTDGAASHRVALGLTRR